jgi:hypothetical protein
MTQFISKEMADAMARPQTKKHRHGRATED